MRLRRRDSTKHRRPKIFAILFAAWVVLAACSYALGMSGGDVAKIFMPIGVAFSVAPFSAQLQKLEKRQPKLQVRPVVKHDAAVGADGVIKSVVRRSWPIESTGSSSTNSARRKATGGQGPCGSCFGRAAAVRRRARQAFASLHYATPAPR